MPSRKLGTQMRDEDRAHPQLALEKALEEAAGDNRGGQALVEGAAPQLVAQDDHDRCGAEHRNDEGGEGEADQDGPIQVFQRPVFEEVLDRA